MATGTINSAKATEIVADGVYALQEFRRRTGLGVHALRMARRGGLPVRRIGRQSFILGRDWLNFVAKSGKSV